MKTSEHFKLCEDLLYSASTSVLSTRYQAGQLKLLKLLEQIQDIFNISEKKDKKSHGMLFRLKGTC